MGVSAREIMIFSDRVIEQGKGWIFFTSNNKRYFAVTAGGRLIVFTESEYDRAIERGKSFEKQIRQFRKKMGVRKL